MKNIRVLLIEASSEMEMGIPPNVAILVSAVKSAGFGVDIFSTNKYLGCAPRIGQFRVGNSPTLRAHIIGGNSMTKLQVSQMDESAEYFDVLFDGRYGDNQHRGGADALYRLKDVLKEIPIDSPKILDYGCGQGDWIQLLSDKYPHAEILGIDISPNGVATASKRYPSHKFYLFDGEKAPFSDNSFDLIFSYHVLDVVLDLNKSLLDLVRLLKKNGILCIIIPCGNKNSFEEKITRLVYDGKEKSFDGYDRFHYSYAANIRRLKSGEMIELCSIYGLKIYKAFFSCHFWGAIDWMLKSNFSLLNEIFNVRKGVNVYAKLKLLFYKVTLMSLLIPAKLTSLSIKKHGNSTVKKILIGIMTPFKPLSAIFANMLTVFARLEWHLCNKRENGSAQYLLFTKCGSMTI